MTDLPIFFETKDFVGIVILLPATALATVALLFSQRLREVALFLIVAGAVFTQKLDIHMMSAYWYRGTTRGFEVTFVDILAVALLLSTILNPLHGGRRWFWPAGLAPMLIFILYAAAVVAMAKPHIFGLYELSKLVRGLVIFLAAACFIRSRRELMIVALALSVAVSLEGMWAIRQRFLMSIYRTPGTLDHANSLSMYLCLVTPVLVAAATSRLPLLVRGFCWVASGFALIAAFLTVSRLGIPLFVLVVAFAAFWCVSWRPSPLRAAGVAAAVMIVSALMWQSWDLLHARYQQASLEEEYFDETAEGRGYYFRLAGAILSDRPFGVGLNNWSYWVSKDYAAMIGARYEDYDDVAFRPEQDLLPMYRYAAPAHNLGVITAGELGWAGLAIFALVWLRWLQVGGRFVLRSFRDPTYRMGFGVFVGTVAVFVHSFTEWNFRQTEIFLTFHLLIGLLAALHYARRMDARTPAPHPQWRVEVEPPAPPQPELQETHYAHRTHPS